MSKEDKRIFVICISLAILIFVAAICCGAFRRDVGRASEYVVQKGDTLYGIAAAHGVADWRKWCYDVAQLNGLDGYELVPGECLIIIR